MAPDPIGMSGQDFFTKTTIAGELTISGVNMHTYGWNIPDLRDLWAVVAVRGQDRIIPGVSGVRPYRRRVTATTVSLPLLVNGMHTPNGVDVTGDEERMAQLQSNIDYLWDNVVQPVNTLAGTRSAVLSLPSGATRIAQIHVLSITPGTWTPWVLKATLDISIPGGRFA